MWGWRLAFILAAAVMSQSAVAEDFLAGTRLYDDVARYASFGTHRFGAAGDRATADWIAGELRQAGFKVDFQPVVLGRQYFAERASAEARQTYVARAEALSVARQLVGVTCIVGVVLPDRSNLLH